MSFVVGPSRNPIVQAAFAGLLAAERSSKSKEKPEVAPQLAHPKADLVESEPYRRLVASMPCKQCGVQGASQAAHPPPDGKGIKHSDLDCFPLCTTRAGRGKKGAVIEGCHPQFDNYKLYPRAKAVKMAKKWGAETRTEIAAAGEWPKGLPPHRKEKVARRATGAKRPATKRSAKP